MYATILLFYINFYFQLHTARRPKRSTVRLQKLTHNLTKLHSNINNNNNKLTLFRLNN